MRAQNTKHNATTASEIYTAERMEHHLLVDHTGLESSFTVQKTVWYITTKVKQAQTNCGNQCLSFLCSCRNQVLEVQIPALSQASVCAWMFSVQKRYQNLTKNRTNYSDKLLLQILFQSSHRCTHSLGPDTLLHSNTGWWRNHLCLQHR